MGFGLSGERSTGVEGSAGNVAELTDRKVEEGEKSEDGDSRPHFYFILIRESFIDNKYRLIRFNFNTELRGK